MVREFLSHIKSTKHKRIVIDLNNYCQLLYTNKLSLIDDRCYEILDKLESIRKFEVESKNKEFANATFLIRVYVNFVRLYKSFILELKEHKFEDSWKSLQGCRDSIEMLLKYEESKTINKINEFLAFLESLYPYKYFSSIEAKQSNITCSICNNDMLSLECSHRPGELYDGLLCRKVVNKIEELHAVAMVKNPHDKRCVIIPQGIDENEYYSMLINLISFIEKPLLEFSIYRDEKNSKYIIKPNGYIQISVKNMFMK